MSPDEKQTLGELISSFGDQDVEITVIDQGKSQPRQTFNQQQQRYGFPNRDGPHRINNDGAQIDVIEVYEMRSPPGRGPPINEPHFHGPHGRGPPGHGPPGRGPPGRGHPVHGSPSRGPPSRRPPSRGPPGRGPPGRGPPGRGPPGRGPPPLVRYPPPPSDHSFEYDDYDQDRSHEHHPHHNEHQKHHDDTSNHQTQRKPPPTPIFDYDDPRRETTDSKKQENSDFLYPESTTSKSPMQQHNVDLSKSNDQRDEEAEGHNVAGYINDFPVIFLNKNEIRK